MRFLLVLDQMLNVVFWNGSQDETVSSHIYRRIESGKANKIERFICVVLRRFERSHCYKSFGE